LGPDDIILGVKKGALRAFVHASVSEDDMRMSWIAMTGLLLLITRPINLMAGQDLPAPSPPWANQMPEARTSSSESQSERQERTRNVYQRKQLEADAEKLLKLATDLKQQVDRTTKDSMSVDVIRKADEIEKLAHKIEQETKR
jgi:hypothetical protein